MPDTLPNTPLPRNTWVDLYADTSISVGTKLLVQNLGRLTVQLAASEAQPANDATGFRIIEHESESTNDVGDSGAWARSLVSVGIVNVRVAP